jgi:hypothetical protein
MVHEDFMLRETSQAHKDKCLLFSLICGSLRVELIEVEDRLQRGRGGEEEIRHQAPKCSCTGG